MISLYRFNSLTATIIGDHPEANMALPPMEIQNVYPSIFNIHKVIEYFYTKQKLTRTNYLTGKDYKGQILCTRSFWYPSRCTMHFRFKFPITKSSDVLIDQMERLSWSSGHCKHNLRLSSKDYVEASLEAFIKGRDWNEINVTNEERCSSVTLWKLW